MKKTILLAFQVVLVTVLSACQPGKESTQYSEIPQNLDDFSLLHYADVKLKRNKIENAAKEQDLLRRIFEIVDEIHFVKAIEEKVRNNPNEEKRVEPRGCVRVIKSIKKKDGTPITSAHTVVDGKTFPRIELARSFGSAPKSKNAHGEESFQLSIVSMALMYCYELVHLKNTLKNICILATVYGHEEALIEAGLTIDAYKPGEGKELHISILLRTEAEALYTKERCIMDIEQAVEEKRLPPKLLARYTNNPDIRQMITSGLSEEVVQAKIFKKLMQGDVGYTIAGISAGEYYRQEYDKRIANVAEVR